MMCERICKKNERLMKLYKTELLVRIIELQKASKGIRRLRAKVKRLTLQKVAEIEERMSGAKYIPPWKQLGLSDWAICGMNHYHIDGEKFLFVSMVKNEKCITEEGRDDIDIWNSLIEKAAKKERGSSLSSKSENVDQTLSAAARDLVYSEGEASDIVQDMEGLREYLNGMDAYSVWFGKTYYLKEYVDTFANR